MIVRRNPLVTLAVLVLAGSSTGVSGEIRKGKEKAENTIAGPGILWREPSDLASRDLYWGAGGPEHQPRPPFQFEKEDLDGSNPKFDVKDAAGTKWKVKLGQEVRSETAASRLAWAVGFFTSEDYLLRDVRVEGLPARLKRGEKDLNADRTIPAARFKREPDDEKKLGIWEWSDPFWGASRELNGLKVVMALINNWDLKSVNNAVYQRGDERIFIVSDLGASFGSPGRSWPESKAKDNLNEYRKSKFIRKLHPDTVDFQTPARPRFVYIVAPKEYFARIHMESIGRNVPREDVQWIGKLLSSLSADQIRDAFRAGGYSDTEVDLFTQTVEKRITQLTDL